MKQKLKFLKSTLLFCFLILFVSMSYAQDRSVTGTVIDDAGDGIPGVSIIVQGTTTGAITDLDGKYTLNVPAEATTLLYSYVGMTTQQVEIGDQTVIDVTMAIDAIGLEEVIVIGYGTAKKKDLTGAIINVQAEDLEMYKPQSVAELLRYAVPGMNVGYSTNAQNNPDFFIRGDNAIKADDDDEDDANAPLIVVDGVIFNGSMTEINTDDIASVDVLKDASAASIYGSRASNGVVAITTKKGVRGKPVFRVSAKYGIVTGAKRLETFKAGDEVMGWLTDMNESINGLTQDPWSIYDKFEDVPDGSKNDWLTANGIAGETDPSVITDIWLDNFGFEPNEKENYHAGIGHDWQDYLFRTGVRQDYDISVSGSTDRVKYYWSLGYFDNESVQVGESFTSLTSRLNLDVAATDFLNLGLNMNFAFQDEGRSTVSSGSYRQLSAYDWPWMNGTEGIVKGEMNLDKIEFLKTDAAGSNQVNPLNNPSYVTRQYERYRIMPTLYATLKLPLNFTFTTRFTPRLDFRKRFEYEDSANPQWGHGGEIRRRHNETNEWQFDNILSWEKEFDQHRFTFTGLINAEKNQSWLTDAETSNLQPTEALGYHAMSFGLNPATDSDDQVVTRNALMARVGYVFANRYHLQASVRRDGYSRFGSENVYGTFPSVSAAWSITNESFMGGAPGWISFLKLRASYGINGNSSGLNSYQAYAQLSDNKWLNYDAGYFQAPYLSLNRMSNPALAWEKNAALNFGLDYGFWNGRLRGALDVYTAETTDLLLDKRLPTVTGFEIITTNVGTLKNTGFDMSINAAIVQTSNWTFNSSLLLHYNKNEIVSLTGELVPTFEADGTPILNPDGSPVLEEPDDLDNGWFIGQSKDVIWDYEVDGVYKIGQEAEAAAFGLFPGDFRVVDQNGDGVLNTDDKVFQGESSAPWYITWRNEVSYKGFDLGVVLLGKLGYKGGSIYPYNERQQYIKNHNWFNLPYWTPNNQIDDAARVNSIKVTDTDIWVNRSYVRLQQVAFGYNIPANITAPIRISRARLGFNIENAAVFTKWIEGDPESMREMPRIYTFSIDFSF
ncbi:MAG TPA: SusC/RagA family TonB-linked outer membrane protein [Bacteroides sp.]|nr:SusC/RagA family TonB-linked outer membrane protein [Bacteroides sp.]